MKNSPKSSLAPLALACFGLASVMGLAACGGGGGEQTATSSAPPAALADPRETSVTPSSTVRWKGVGSVRIGLAGITQSTDGGVWALGAEDGDAGRPFLRKIGGANTCGADGLRFLSEVYTRFDRRQGPVSMTTVVGADLNLTHPAD